MFKKIISRIKAIWNLPEENEKRYRQIMSAIRVTQEQVNERCEVHADIHYKSPHQIIVIGRYKNHDYVRIFGVSEPSFYQLIERLRAEEHHSRVGRFDMPGNWPTISAVYERERF
jgi:hypothetical protein